jgi:dual specificity tyrosine-phosphorylation-regulated kinase 2/3/4
LLKQFGKTGIKVIDFGSSCFEKEKLYTYIQSRFYRAPEIILGLGYGIEIDMWSFGCIIAELFTGIPIFPGENERDQLNYMMEYLDIPPSYLLEKSKKRNNFFEDIPHVENEEEGNISTVYKPIESANSQGKIRIPNTKKVKKFLRNSDDNFIDLVKRCLTWDQSQRIKPDEAILHPWITFGMPKDVLQYHKNKIQHKHSSSTCNKYVGTITNSPTKNKGSSHQTQISSISQATTHVSSMNSNSKLIKPEKLEMNIINKNANNIFKNKPELKSIGPLINKSKINLTLDININITNKKETSNNKN